MSRAYSQRTRTLGSTVGTTVRNWLSRTPKIVKSIQRGTITLTGVASNTATITSVVLANSVLVWLGQSSTDVAVSSTDRSYTAVSLTNSTTVTGTRSSASSNVTVSFEVIEYYPGVIKSVQRGTVVSAATSTITAVDVSKSVLTFLGYIGSLSTYVGLNTVCTMVLTNSTTITCTGGDAVHSMGWQVVEYY